MFVVICFNFASSADSTHYCLHRGASPIQYQQQQQAQALIPNSIQPNQTTTAPQSQQPPPQNSPPSNPNQQNLNQPQHLTQGQQVSSIQQQQQQQQRMQLQQLAMLQNQEQKRRLSTSQQQLLAKQQARRNSHSQKLQSQNSQMNQIMQNNNNSNNTTMGNNMGFQVQAVQTMNNQQQNNYGQVHQTMSPHSQHSVGGGSSRPSSTQPGAIRRQSATGTPMSQPMQRPPSAHSRPPSVQPLHPLSTLTRSSSSQPPQSSLVYPNYQSPGLQQQALGPGNPMSFNFYNPMSTLSKNTGDQSNMNAQANALQKASSFSSPNQPGSSVSLQNAAAQMTHTNNDNVLTPNIAALLHQSLASAQAPIAAATKPDRCSKESSANHGASSSNQAKYQLKAQQAMTSISALSGGTSTTTGTSTSNTVGAVHHQYHPNHNSALSNEDVLQLANACPVKQKIVWVARQLLSSAGTNGFTRATSTVQRLKRQRARAKHKSEERGSTEKDDTIDQEALKAETFNVRLAQRMATELKQVIVHYLVFLLCVEIMFVVVLQLFSCPGVAIYQPHDRCIAIYYWRD